MRKRVTLTVALLLLAGASLPANADLLDPLHGYCAVGCIDNGTNSPTNNPTNFGFTISPGSTPQTGDLTLDVLVPNNVPHPASFAITGTLSGTATLFSATAWTSGFLDVYLGISASPSNPIGAYLPSTQALDPGASGFFVFQVDLGSTTLQGAQNPNVSPLLNISPKPPIASYIVGFFNEGGGNIVATANSGAIFITPLPPAALLFGTALVGLGILGRRGRKDGLKRA
jgi:hypothetical protein